MLKTLRYLLIIVLSVSAFSCKKGDQSTAGLKEQLVDKWYYDSIYQKDYDSNGKLTKSTQLPVLVNSNFINFKSDDTYTVVLRTESDTEPNKFSNVTSNGTYKINSLTKFTLMSNGDVVDCTIKSLTARELIFNMNVTPRTTGQPYTVVEHTLHR